MIITRFTIGIWAVLNNEIQFYDYHFFAKRIFNFFNFLRICLYFFYSIINKYKNDFNKAY